MSGILGRQDRISPAAGAVSAMPLLFAYRGVALARRAGDDGGRHPSGGWAEQADVASEDDCGRVFARTIAAFGGLDVLVNNAGRWRRLVLEADARLGESERRRFWNAPPAP